MTQTTYRVTGWLRRGMRQLPEHPYPSDHPWRVRHDAHRPRG
jgi:hypothetical protein